MNDKILCFKIDGNNLYLEISLIYFNEIPIFFYVERQWSYVRCSMY